MKGSLTAWFLPDVTTELIVQYVRAMEGAAGSQIKTLHRLVDGAVEALDPMLWTGTPIW